MIKFIVLKKYKIIIQEQNGLQREYFVTPTELRQLRLEIAKAERQK